MENLLFKDLQVSKEVLKGIEQMGFEELTPIQSQAIPPMLEGLDLIAQAPTGTGKTCAFGIPLIEKIDVHNEMIQILILCPTRELVIQTAEELKNVAAFKRGIRSVPIYGGQQIDRQIMGLKKRPQIIIATPGRLMDHMRRKTIKLEHLTMVVLDEADEMLNMGFREDIDLILATAPKERQTVLFSATISKEIMEIARMYQKDAQVVRVTHKELTVPTIEQFYLEVRSKNKLDVLTRLVDMNRLKLSLVFCNTKRMVDELTANLSARGYSAEGLHGDMKQSQRDRVMERFRKGIVEILVATDVAARGLDVDDVDAVFNYDIPNDEEYYVHRIGRTGRAKRKGISYTFASGKEMMKLKDIMRYTKAKINFMPVPAVSDVEEVKISSLAQEIFQVAKNTKITQYVNHIESMINNDDSNELTTLEIAAALLFMQIGPIDKVEEIPRGQSADEPTRRREERGTGKSTGARKINRDKNMTRMFLNIGTFDKIKSNQIIEMIANNTSVKPNQIGFVEVYDKFSFLELPKDKCDEVMQDISGLEFRGRTISMEKANKKK